MSQTYTKIVLLLLLCTQISGFAALFYQQTQYDTTLVRQLSEQVQVVSAEINRQTAEQQQILSDWHQLALKMTESLNSDPAPTSAHDPLTAQEVSELVGLVVQQELDALYTDLNASLHSGYQQDALVETEAKVDTAPFSIDPVARAQAMNESVSIVDAAIERGEWISEDSDFLLSKMALLDREQTLMLVRRIGRAVNSQQLRVDASVSMPF